MPVDTLSCLPEGQSVTVSMIDILAGPEPDLANTEEWLKITDDYIKKWRYGLPNMEEESIEPPTKNVMLAAENLAEFLSGQYFKPPSRIVPNGEGGIVFERYEQKDNDNIYEAIEISVNLEIEVSYYKNSKLINKYLLSSSH